MKKQMYAFYCTAAVFTLFLSFAPVYGDDINSPESVQVITPFGAVTWNRPDNPDGSGLDSTATPQTTFHAWEGAEAFFTGAPPNAGSGFGSGLYTGGIGGTPHMIVGTVQDPSLFLISVPNFIDTDPVKLVRLQVTSMIPIDLSNVIVIGFEGNFEDSYAGTLLSSSGTDMIGDLYYAYQDWMIEPNPDFEQLNIRGSFQNGTFQVVQVVIDTISMQVPEPATMAILGSSVILGALVKKKRKNGI